MINQQPNKIFRGTWEQLISIKDQISPEAVLELKVFESPPADNEEGSAYGGKTAADVVREIGFVHGGPSDLSTNPKHMEGFGEERNARKIEP